MVSTLRCGRNNPGSNPGHGNYFSKNILAKRGTSVVDIFWRRTVDVPTTYVTLSLVLVLGLELGRCVGKVRHLPFVGRMSASKKPNRNMS